MGLRPVPARWFQVLTDRNDVSRVAEALARTGMVQIEAETELGAYARGSDVQEALREYEQLARRFHPYWPEQEVPSSGPPAAPAAVAKRALASVAAWSADAAPQIEALQQLEQERAELELLAELCDVPGAEDLDLAQLRDAGPTLSAHLFVVSRTAAMDAALPARPLVRRWVGEEHAFFVVVGKRSDAADVEQVLASAKARRVAIPDWVPPRGARQALKERLAAIEGLLEGVWAALHASHVRHELAAALCDLRRLRWFADSVPALAHTRHFAVITGWTKDQSGALLDAALDAVGVPTILDFPSPGPSREPPVVLNNPKWVKPFETFPGLLGTPARYEPDPSPVLAVLAPLLFGFMFGDVGQGAVLVLLGLILRKRFPATALLISGGAMAIVFGVLFGSVFASERVIAPLWVHPLSAPLPLLAVSVVGGSAILLVGLLLSAFEARWRGGLSRWLSVDAAVLVIYLGVVGMAVDARAGFVAIFGVAWHLVGSGVAAPKHPLKSAAAAGGHLIERVLQLLVNTVSFARVGAFALAHAGLCSAIEGLSHAAGGALAATLVLVVGNAFTVVLEGLVVSIQTTRLVLFEFFARFLRGEGRAFQPLTPPALTPPAPAPGGKE